MCSRNNIYILFVLLLHASSQLKHIYAFVPINCVCFCVFFLLFYVSLLFIFALSSVFYLAFFPSHFPSHLLSEEKWFFSHFHVNQWYFCVSIARWHEKKGTAINHKLKMKRNSLVLQLILCCSFVFLLDLVEWTRDWLQIKEITLKLLTKSNFRFGISSYYSNCNNVRADPFENSAESTISSTMAKGKKK